MQFFIDTADIEEIKQIQSHFSLNGVTTNPTLIAKTGKKRETLIPQICDLVDGPVSAEAIELEEELLFKESLALSKLHKNVVVKIPLVPVGLKVTQRLKKENIPVNVTLCFSPLQALMAGKAGAKMVSIFAGRLDDIGQSSIQTISDTLDIFSNYDIETQVLSASIRHTQHILQSALAGADIVTAPYKILKNLIQHPLTDIGLEQFLKSAKALK